MTRNLLEKIRALEEKTGKSWMESVVSIQSTEELMKKAEQWGVPLTEEEAEEGFTLLQTHDIEELTEEEMANIAAGAIKFH